jgi:hypothetical protein
MPTETEIANYALQHLGESQINSLYDTGDKVSRTCGLCYPQARDEVLSMAPWSCAKKATTLSRIAGDTGTKWLAAYQLPTDLIRLVSIAGANAWMPTEYFDRMGGVLYVGSPLATADSETVLSIEYVSRQDDASQFDPLLVEAIACKMAMKMAKTLTGSDGKAKELREEYERVILPHARTVNATQLYTGKNNTVMQRLKRSLLNRGVNEDF